MNYCPVTALALSRSVTFGIKVLTPAFYQVILKSDNQVEDVGCLRKYLSLNAKV